MAEPGWPARDIGAQWCGHVAGGHATTQVHVGARVGRHVSRSREETLGQLIGESSPLFNRVLPLYFFRVGLCSHTVLTLQATWTRGERRISSWTATIAWTRVHAISDSGTCRKYKGKWPDLRIYLKTRGKLRRSMTKNYNCSPIVSRSRRDRSSIVPRLGPPFVAESF